MDGRSLQVERSSEPTDQWWRSDEVMLWRWLSEWQQSLDEVHREVTVLFPFHVEVHAERWQQDVEADGSAEPFTFVGNAKVWLARGAVRGQQVEITSQCWPAADLGLESVSPRDVHNRE